MSSKFRTGIDQIQKTASGSSGKRFTPNIYWKDGESKALIYLTEADQVPKVKLHQMIRIPDDKFEKGFRYETFLCRKDPSMTEEHSGYCELCDRVKAVPSEKFVALAVELEVARVGRKVTGLSVMMDTWKNKDGEEQTSPRWGLVIQSSKNFFAYLASYHESVGLITDVAFDVNRTGKSTDTKYNHFPLSAALPDLSGLDLPLLEDILEGMGSDEKYTSVAEIAAGSQPTFGGSSTSADSGTVPAGDRQSEFERIREELEAKSKETAKAY